MIHAGVADSRQWNNEFVRFADRYRVVRYDKRGFGKSEPVEGDYTDLLDLAGLIDFLGLDRPLVLMGCSMGGGLALDFALERPADVRALIMVGSGPRGLELDVPTSPKFAEAEEAYNAGDLDRVAEIEAQIWFDGEGRSPGQVNPAMRRLAYEMNRLALDHDAKHLGSRLPDTALTAAERLGELQPPLLIVVGNHDTLYIQAAADHILERVPSARKVVLQDAAHLPNMEHPDEFERIVAEFLGEVGA
jgi:pimeloyl-ACP methyl ester carboxylesterase